MGKPLTKQLSDMEIMKIFSYFLHCSVHVPGFEESSLFQITMMPVITRSTTKRADATHAAAVKGNSSPPTVRKASSDDQRSIRQRRQKTKKQIPEMKGDDEQPEDRTSKTDSIFCDDTRYNTEDETCSSDASSITTEENGSNESSESEQKGSGENTKDDTSQTKKSDQKGSWVYMYLGAFVIVSVVCCLYVVLIPVRYMMEDSIQAHSKEKQFIMDMQSLQSDFPSQEKHLWDTVVATVKNHGGTESEPNCPIILLFGSRHNASDTSTCLVKRLGQTLSQTLGRESSHAAQIDGQHFKYDSADDAKLEIDRLLREAFEEKAGPKAATILNLDAFPPCSVLLFHSYCDTDNAIFKNVALIFTVTLDGLPPGQEEVASRSKHWETLVNDHLTKVWVDKCSKLPREKVQALLSRVANNVAIVRQEKQPKC